MKSFLQKILLIFIYLSSLMAFSQETSFEINIINDSLSILPTFFLNEINNGTIGLVLKAPLYKPPEQKYYTSYLYEISKTGDTLSYEFVKTDTILVYYNMIRVDLGEPGYLLSGLDRALDNDKIFTVFTRLDTALNIMWEKIYKFNYIYSAWSMRMLQLKDSSFLYYCSPQLNTNMFLFKLSYDGDSIAYRAYEGDSAGWAQGITYNPDSTGYWLHNEWGLYHHGVSKASCITVNENLEQTGVYYFYGPYQAPFTSKLMPDGTLITAGASRMYNPEPIKYYITVIKYDSLFNQLYLRNLTNPDTNSRGGELIAVDYYYSSCIYVAGTHNLQGLSGHEPSWFYVAKMDDTLGIDFEKYIGGDDYYWLYSVVATKDGGVLLAGTRSEVGAPDFHRDGYIIKLDSTGCITNLSANSTIQIKDALVYPNPGTDKLIVRTALKNCVIRLYDMKGTEVLEQPLDKHITEINTRQLKPGMYVYVIQQNNRIVENGKWIKQQLK